MYAIRSYYGKGLSYVHAPKEQSNKASLRRFIKKNLFVRLCVAGMIISVVLATVVFFLEIKRLGRLVNNRASDRITSYNVCYTKLLRCLIKLLVFFYHNYVNSM